MENARLVFGHERASPRRKDSLFHPVSMLLSIRIGGRYRGREQSGYQGMQCYGVLGCRS